LVDAIGIFEGGGAKGIAHIGGLRAAEELKISFRAVAGTSAGAIVAALVAAGYSADEILRAGAEGIPFEPRI
jgi:NTE family protein